MFWVYMLRCADHSFYIGHTDNLDVRVAQHIQGAFKTCYTYERRPVHLVYSQDFPHPRRSSSDGKAHQRLESCEESSVDCRRLG